MIKTIRYARMYIFQWKCNNVEENKDNKKTWWFCVSCSARDGVRFPLCNLSLYLSFIIRITVEACCDGVWTDWSVKEHAPVMEG